MTDFHTERKASLAWWQTLTTSMRSYYVTTWKKDLSLNDRRQQWPDDMIFASDNCIQAIYKYIN